MSAMLLIACDEWRLWYRSRLHTAGAFLFTLLLVSITVFTFLKTTTEKNQRIQHQAEADSLFEAQPDRHPHRMVHYGHYVFRTPAPLAVFDPGVDEVTGESIFLEGHRQNDSTFADARSGVNLGAFGRLTPALLYQVFFPLLLIALGHGIVLREYESGTLATMIAQGTSATAIVFGKLLALIGVVSISLIPATAIVASAVVNGESLMVGAALISTYAVYLLTWTVFILLISLIGLDRSLTLGILLLTWTAVAVITPRLGVAVARARHFTPSKVEADLQMQTELRALGDGHSLSGPVFARLRDKLLKQHGVERVEDLPVNIRGVMAEASEAELTKVLNAYAEKRMVQQL
ncbi:MAG: ABC transporter permease subunit, partial [Myxococcota bacterium]